MDFTAEITNGADILHERLFAALVLQHSILGFSLQYRRLSEQLRFLNRKLVDNDNKGSLITKAWVRKHQNKFFVVL